MRNLPQSDGACYLVSPTGEEQSFPNLESASVYASEGRMVRDSYGTFFSPREVMVAKAKARMDNQDDAMWSAILAGVQADMRAYQFPAVIPQRSMARKGWDAVLFRAMWLKNWVLVRVGR